MIPIGNKRIERENYKIRQKFVSEVFIDFSKKCYGNEYYFNKVSYYFGNGHPCINIIWANNRSTETRIEFCNNGKVILKVKYLHQINQNKYSNGKEFIFDIKLSLKMNRSKLFKELGALVFSLCDTYFYDINVPRMRKTDSIYPEVLLRTFLLKLKNDIIIKNLPTYINCYDRNISTNEKTLIIFDNNSLIYSQDKQVYIYNLINNIIKNCTSEVKRETKIKYLSNSI